MSYAGINREQLDFYRGATRTVLSFLITKCNFQNNLDYIFENTNIPIYRGQLITSIDRIAEWTGLGTKPIRTALKILQEDGVICSTDRPMTNSSFLNKFPNLDQSYLQKLYKNARLVTIINVDNYLFLMVSGAKTETNTKAETGAKTKSVANNDTQMKLGDEKETGAKTETNTKAETGAANNNDITNNDLTNTSPSLDIFNFWNEKKIIKHKIFTDSIKRKINTALKVLPTEDIKQAINNYALIVNGQEYFFKYRWTLVDFLQRGIEKFSDLEVAKQNYVNAPRGHPSNSNFKSEDLNKYNGLI